MQELPWDPQILEQMSGDGVIEPYQFDGVPVPKKYACPECGQMTMTHKSQRENGQVYLVCACGHCGYQHRYEVAERICVDYAQMRSMLQDERHLGLLVTFVRNEPHLVSMLQKRRMRACWTCWPGYVLVACDRETGSMGWRWLGKAAEYLAVVDDITREAMLKQAGALEHSLKEVG